MSIVKFSIKQKVLVNLITAVAIILGIFVAINMQREVFPAVQVDYVFVKTIYPGASPQEVEKLVTIPIEDELNNIDGIDTYSSTSGENISFIFIELDQDITNRDRVINEIARTVDKVELPDDCEDPETEEFILEDPILEISFAGKNVPESELRDYVKNFEQILKDMDGVGSIDRVGYRDKEISIEIDPQNLDKYYISLAEVINSIKRQHLNLPGGKMDTDTQEIRIRTIGEIDTPEGFKDIIVRTNSDGKYLSVRDIASVNHTFEEQSRIYKTDGKVSINLTPKKKKSADTITVADKIKKEVEKYKKVVPKNVSIDILNDMSFYVKRRLNVLKSNGLMGLVLLILTLILFLNIRVALVTALGIPFAFMSALILMNFFNVSLNLITMFGLILVLGMIVDDAIVVSENVYRYMEEGMDPREAAIKGTEEVIAPVTATILTTTAAFLPLMFISGIMGKFLRFFPMGVIFCLAASLFEALVILPSHLAEWIRPLKANTHTKYIKVKPDHNNVLIRLLRFPVYILSILKHYLSSHDRKGSEAAWFQKLLDFYTRVLRKSLKHRYKMAVLMLFILIVSIIFSVKFMPVKLFPDMIEIFYVRIERIEGSSLADSNESISKIEEIIMQLPGEELKNVTTTVGFSGEIGGGPFDKHGSKYAQCVVYLTPEDDRSRKADAIIADLRKKIEELDLVNVINLEFAKLQGGPPVGKPVSIIIKGEEYETLNKMKAKIMGFLATIDGVEDIKDDYELGKQEVQISIDKKEASRLGLDVFTVATTIRYAYEGGVASTLRKGDEDIDVVVRISENYRTNLDILKKLTIPNNRGRLIRLDKVANFKTEQGLKSLHHKEGKRRINITASIDGDKITAVAANKKVIDKFENISEEFPGFVMEIGGEWEDTQESIQSMFKAFLIAFMIIYVILATQFNSFIQPFIIMLSVPFGIIGVVVALFLHGQPISLMALFGIVGLTGVVVNDSLILVDFINRRVCSSGLSFEEAAIDAGRTRLRPILLTSITTIVALVPLIYGIGGKEPFLVPAAIAMAYGLLAATFLTLVIVPTVFLIVNDIKRLCSKKK